MELDAIHAGLEGVYGIDYETGAELYNRVISEQSRQILHTGWRTPNATCYLAGALQQLGGGRVIALDDCLPGKTHPNVAERLEALGLSSLVERRQSEAGRIWLLQQLAAAAGNAPRFDLIFLEDARDLALDGLTLMLAERWLKARGVLVLSGLHWTYGKSPKLKDTPQVRAMPSLLRDKAQADLVANAIGKSGGILKEEYRSGKLVVFRKRERLAARVRRALGKPAVLPLPQAN